MFILLATTMICFYSAQAAGIFAENKGSNGCKVTSASIVGPYYKEGATLTVESSNYPNVCFNTPAHDRLFLNGTIRMATADLPCGKPVRAMLDIWQANCDGVYSDTSLRSSDYGCRTKLVSNNDGFFTLSTVLPGRYDDNGYRPAHIHFRISPVDLNGNPIGRRLTTQLYFARDAYLSPRDSCQICHSDEPTLILHIDNQADLKSFFGSWDILLHR